MTEALWLRRYVPFLAAAAFLHAGLFLSDLWQISPAEIELHPGVRAVPLRLVSAARPFPSASRASEKPSPPVPVEPRPVEPRTMEKTQGLQERTPKPSPLAPGDSKAPPAKPVPPPPSSAPPNEIQAESTPVTPASADSVEATQVEAEIASAPASASPQGVVIEARPVSARTPEYPPRSILRGEQGRVVIRLDVDSNGRARNVEIVEGSGHFRLDRSVLRFARKERFVPATRAGVPIDSTQTFSFRFELHDAPH